MQAAYVRAPWQFEVREVPIPAVKPGWVLIKVEACGVCGTDLHIAGYMNHQLTRHPPTQWQPFGHEVAGIVAAVGEGVGNVKEGDTVALESGSYCGVCEQCRNGRVDLCNRAPNFWSNPSMGFADYILAPWQACVPFSGLSFPVASLAEPLGVALDMSYTADIRLGNEVLVLGLGPIGLMSIPIARRLGAARIYAVNRSGGKRADLACHYGADEVVLLGDAPLRTVPFRKGIDRALVSATPDAIANAMPVMNYGGILSYIGIAYGEEATVRFDANEFHFKKLQLRASHASPAIYFPAVLQLLKDGHVDGAAIISHTMPLEKIGEAMLLARDKRDEVLKIIITPGRS
jgi:L-iditol 2-dehydrogenase